MERLPPVSRPEGAGGGGEEQWADEDPAGDAERVLAGCPADVQRSSEDLSCKFEELSFELRYQNHTYHALLTSNSGLDIERSFFSFLEEDERL